MSLHSSIDFVREEIRLHRFREKWGSGPNDFVREGMASCSRIRWSLMPHIPTPPTGPVERAQTVDVFDSLGVWRAIWIDCTCTTRTRKVRANAAMLPSPVPTFVPVDAGKCFVLICGYTGKEVVR